jgi:hypothetical protein
MERLADCRRVTRLVAGRVTMLAAQFLLALAAHAAPVTVGPVTVGPVIITVPEGFEAAQTQRLKKTLITAWTKSVRSAGLKTLLQINVIDFGSAPGRPAAPQDLNIYAERYLHQFLDGIEHRRTNYVSSPIAHIKLAGLPAARATWNGAVGGRAAVGVMYSVIVHNRFAVIFHTQDLGSTPTSGMFEAMQSIEAATLADRPARHSTPQPGMSPAPAPGISVGPGPGIS